MWRRFLVIPERTFEIDGAVILPVDVFKASGHLDHFKDPIIQCRKCHAFFRVDKLLEEKGVFVPEAAPISRISQEVEHLSLRCPKCGAPLKGEDVSHFNLMFELKVGPEGTHTAYLRPETCQSIFASFNRILQAMGRKLPFGVAQVGKVFRNEISPRGGLVRLREITQMEYEYFFDPQWDMEHSPYLDTEVVLDDAPVNARDLPVSKTVFKHFMAKVWRFFKSMGFSNRDMRFRQLDDQEKAFYALYAFDLEVRVEDRWLEVVANNYRQDYDLKRHMEASGQDMRVDGRIPHLWEVSMGLDRIFYALLKRSYREDKRRKFVLPPFLSPYDVAIFPLMAKPPLMEKARQVRNALLSKGREVWYEEKGSIGKRYARADEIGIRYAGTVDYQTLEDGTITIRDNKDGSQVRVPLSQLDSWLDEHLTLSI